jgi:hypothetical protein
MTSSPPRPLSPRRRTSKALAYVARGKSLAAASRLAGTTPKTVQKYAGKRLHRSPDGHYTARLADQRMRYMSFITPTGQIGIDVRGSVSATRIATYYNAVRRYLDDGDLATLLQFRGKTLQSGGARYRFVTDLHVLERLANAGDVRTESIYLHRR